MPNEASNKREFTRVPVNCHVEVKSADHSIRCTAVRTLSMNGMFVLTSEQPPVGSEWEINISLVEHEIEIELLERIVTRFSTIEPNTESERLPETRLGSWRSVSRFPSTA
jgi:hypothetical protein